MTDEEMDQMLEVARRAERPRGLLEERLQLVEDRRQITDLVILYGWLCDRRQWDELLDHYSDDFQRVLLGTLRETASKEEVAELYRTPKLPRRDGLSGPPPAAQLNSYELRHMIHPPVVRVGDDNSTATAAAVYSMVVSSGEVPNFRRGEHEGGYIFDFRRDNDIWKFTRMVVISENARNPMFQASS